MQTDFSVQQLQHVINILELLNDEEYVMEMEPVFESSVGKHTRHIIEFYAAFLKGIETGEICYENRKRNHLFETDKILSINVLRRISSQISNLKFSKKSHLKLFIASENYFMKTSMEREFHYLQEHTTHHLAFIRLGLHLINSELELCDTIGIASSTLQNARE